MTRIGRMGSRIARRRRCSPWPATRNSARKFASLNSNCTSTMRRKAFTLKAKNRKRLVGAIVAALAALIFWRWHAEKTFSVDPSGSSAANASANAPSTSASAPSTAASPAATAVATTSAATRPESSDAIRFPFDGPIEATGLPNPLGFQCAGWLRARYERSPIATIKTQVVDSGPPTPGEREHRIDALRGLYPPVRQAARQDPGRRRFRQHESHRGPIRRDRRSNKAVARRFAMRHLRRFCAVVRPWSFHPAPCTMR